MWSAGASRGLRGWTGASQDEEKQRVLGVEGTEGQQDHKSGAWKCHIGYTQKTPLGQIVKGHTFWKVRLLFCGQLGAKDICKQETAIGPRIKPQPCPWLSECRTVGILSGSGQERRLGWL